MFCHTQKKLPASPFSYLVSLSLSFLVPRYPAPGNETVLASPKPLPAE